MTDYPDIHTHRPAPAAGGGFRLVNASPAGFAPQAGCLYSVGLHPWTLTADGPGPDEWARLAEAVRLPQVLAVGEAGLDKLAEAPLEVQEAVLARQARLAEETGKPLVVHLVRAADELLRLRKRLRPRMPWVIHGFRGKEQLAAEWVRHGLYLSFGAQFRAEALRAVPLDRLFLETDESLLPVAQVYARAAQARGMTADELAAAVRANVRAVFLRGGGLPEECGGGR